MAGVSVGDNFPRFAGFGIVGTTLGGGVDEIWARSVVWAFEVHKVVLELKRVAVAEDIKRRWCVDAVRLVNLSSNNIADVLRLGSIGARFLFALCDCRFWLGHTLLACGWLLLD